MEQITEAREVLEDCQLEWNRTTGVLYVHNKTTGCSVLRIQNLAKSFQRKDFLTPGQMIDIQCINNHVGYPEGFVVGNKV